MKKISIVIVIVTLLTLQNSFAKTINSATVQEQLENLNKNWKDKNLNYPILRERIPLTDDVSLIQMHLTLVEKTLRNKKVDNLSAEQKQNRIKCLDILHIYSTNGVFPKNLYHSTRTPYFIDKFGTACAVGQLIISTGYGEFAKKVMEENNNAYISELNSQYSEINKWATEFGFTIDELAWIQPCYCSMFGTGTVNVSCYGMANGYFCPAPTGGVLPYTYTGWYWWNGTGWSLLPCGGCDLIAGDYKCTVTDAVGTVQDYFATITQPPAITQTINFTNDNGTCNGSAIVAPSGGTPSYTYSWMPGGYTNDTITNLCTNTYSLTITDNNGCISTDTVNISLSSVCSITFIGDPTNCGLCNGYLTAMPTGQPPFSYSWSTGDTTQTISGLCAGIYSLTVTDSNSCSVTDTVIVSGSSFMATVTGTDATCSGCCDGTGDVTAGGSSPPYTYLWDCNGATTASVTGLCAGNCFIQVTDGMGCTFFLTLTINEPPLEINSSDFYSSTLLYPNPTNQFATLEFNNPTKQNCTFTLYDLRGQILRTMKNITKEKIEIERQNLVNGLYFFKLYTDRQIIATGKLTIE